MQPNTNPREFCKRAIVVMTIFSLIHCSGDNFLFVTTKPPVIVPADAATTAIIPAKIRK